MYLKLMVVTVILIFIVSCEGLMPASTGAINSDCDGYGGRFALYKNATDCERNLFEY